MKNEQGGEEVPEEGLHGVWRCWLAGQDTGWRKIWEGVAGNDEEGVYLWGFGHLTHLDIMKKYLFALIALPTWLSVSAQNMVETVEWLKGKLVAGNRVLGRNQFKFDYKSNVLFYKAEYPEVGQDKGWTREAYEMRLDLLSPTGINFVSCLQNKNEDCCYCYISISGYNNKRVIKKIVYNGDKIAYSQMTNFAKLKIIDYRIMDVDLAMRIKKALNHAILLAGGKKEAF